MANVLYERAVDLMEAALGDEIVALDPAGGHCFGFNSVAASVWRQLSQPRSFAELKTSLLDEFDVSDAECEADLAKLLEQLATDGLIRARTPDLPPGPQ